MTTIRYTGDQLWDRIERAVEKVKDRLRRVTTALEAAGVPYAVVGGNAVQIWVAQVDESAVRNTRDVDIILNRSDLSSAIDALTSVGFIYRHDKSVDRFLDGSDAKARDAVHAVHVVFAGEKVREEYAEPVPLIDSCEVDQNVRTLPLEALVRMALTCSRIDDLVDLRDLIDVGLVDETWPSRYTPALGSRLQALLDDPEG